MAPGDQFWLDIRFFFGAAWYEKVSLPDKDEKNYVLRAYLRTLFNAHRLTA